MKVDRRIATAALATTLTLGVAACDGDAEDDLQNVEENIEEGVEEVGEVVEEGGEEMQDAGENES